MISSIITQKKKCFNSIDKPPALLYDYPINVVSMSSTNDVPSSSNNDKEQVDQDPAKKAKPTAAKARTKAKLEGDMAKAIAKMEVANVAIHQAIDLINEGIILSPFDADAWKKTKQMSEMVTQAAREVFSTGAALSLVKCNLPSKKKKWEGLLLNITDPYQKVRIAWEKLCYQIYKMRQANSEALIAKHLTKDDDEAILCADEALQTMETAMTIIPEAIRAWETFYDMMPEDNSGSTGA
jgi:hypothetical protein